MSSYTRAEFLKTAAAFTVGFSGLHKLLESSGNSITPLIAKESFGPLVKDPKGMLDLPKGFTYKIISKKGDKMSDGFYVPGRADGMATFKIDDHRMILIRNHEISDGEKGVSSAFGENYELVNQLKDSDFYDKGVNSVPADGGTTTIVYNTKTQKIEKEYLSLAGTLRNCAGGATPWNTWLTCEEIILNKGGKFEKDHGYVFEVPASEEICLAKPEPILDMGRFNHEAVAVDPISNAIYLTEDDSQGLLYRFLPNTPSKLLDGGRLQALKVKETTSFDSRNWETNSVKIGEQLEVEWMDLADFDIHHEELRLHVYEAGATRFARGEGMWYGNGCVYFACTNGGANKKGQIWQYKPSEAEGTVAEVNNPGILELFVEPNDGSVIENADNLTVAPWGDLIVCEDGPDTNYLLGVTPEGEVYKFARNNMSSSEMAGATFSPDGTTLFMNMQEDGLTVAITGPWKKI